MTAYLITLVLCIVSPAMLGDWIARQLPVRAGNKLSPGSAIVVLGLIASWFLAAWWARPYADTERPGAALAEWFAFSGKWWVLLAGVMFGHGIATGTRQIPPPGLRLALYLGALLMLAGLAASRTVPVYFLLGDGRRDANGYVLESKAYQYTCGAVALLNYLEQERGVKGLTERTVSLACGVTMEGTTSTALVQAARSYGLTNATARVLSWPELEKLGRPAIVSISTLPQMHHATLLVGLDAEQVYFIDPAYGLWKTSRERFRQIWYGKTVLLE